MATPEDIAKTVGEQYVNNYPVMPDDENEEFLVRLSFEAMADINRELFEEIPVEVVFQEEDPYDSYNDMHQSVEETGVLRVFSGGDPHPIWNHDDELIGRAVHDWHGHLTFGTGFNVVGEYRNWLHNRAEYPRYAERVFFTEVIGQLGAAYYLPDGFASDRFEQKVFPAPPEWIEDLDMSLRDNGYLT